MAKQRRQDDFDDAVREEAPLAAVSTVDHEKQALRDRIAELEALLNVERTAKVVDVATPNAQGDYWRVKLKHGPDHVVRAQDAPNAWEVFRREMGVLVSDHRPEVAVASREEYHAAQAKRHGVRPEEFRLPD